MLESEESFDAGQATTYIDRSAIDIRDERSCRYWCNELGVRPKVLKSAVRRVGNRPEDVKRELSNLMNVQVDTTG